MQHRMKEFTMTPQAITALLERGVVGRISTVGADGYPYTVGVHYLWQNEKLYFHGLPVGEKLENIARCSKVCFELDECTAVFTQGIENPCSADAAYESVVIRGDARLVEDRDAKEALLWAIAEKYLPNARALPMPEARILGTAVVEITPCSLTGKYHE